MTPAFYLRGVRDEYCDAGPHARWTDTINRADLLRALQSGFAQRCRIDMLGYLFWHRVAHKLVYYAVAAGPFALVFWLCRDYFSGWPDAARWRRSSPRCSCRSWSASCSKP